MNTQLVSWLAIAIVAAVTFVVSTIPVTAEIVPTLESVTPATAGFDFNYRVAVAAGQTVEGDFDFFTFYDVDGVVNAAFENLEAGWIPFAGFVGITPAGVSPDDDPLVRNVTFSYIGGPIVGPSDIGIFTITSIFSTSGSDSFASRATRSSGPEAGTKISTLSTATVPKDLQAPVPESTTLWLVGAGAAVLAMARWRRKPRH